MSFRDGGRHQPVLGIVNLKANRSPVYSPRHKLQTMRPAISGSILEMSGATCLRATRCIHPVHDYG